MPGRWDLKGMTCVVTGGSKGLGLACVTEMLQLGASVLLTARGGDELEAVHKQHSAQHSGRVHILAADVSEASGREAVSGAVKGGGGVPSRFSVYVPRHRAHGSVSCLRLVSD